MGSRRPGHPNGRYPYLYVPILTYKEELLTHVKNMLYRHTDDVERLQKVVADTEQ
jgi:hypothetical protein